MNEDMRMEWDDDVRVRGEHFNSNCHPVKYGMPIHSELNIEPPPPPGAPYHLSYHFSIFLATYTFNASILHGQRSSLQLYL
jgi:hypothetical protein